VTNQPIYPGQATQKVAHMWWLAVVFLALTALLGATNGDIIFKDSFENHAPVITSLPVTTALINAEYTYNVIATDIDGDLLQYGLVVSPDNMSIGEFSGEISWTPNQLGLFAVELLVSDGNGGTAQQQWEIDVQAALDSDGDGLSDDEELILGTDPNDPDTDNDGLTDGEEVKQYGTDPLDADTDNDGLSDGDEINIYSTLPDNPDTDNDTYRDGEEIAYGTDPLDDTDFPVNVPPADPADVAPDNDPTVATTVFGSTEFLYRGPNRVQTGVANGVIEPVRVAVIRGTVMSRDGAALSGVLVTAHDHPEFGETTSRADGMFDLVVNGGGYLTVNYDRDGYLPAQRQVDVPWQDYVWVPEVALIPLDTQVTAIDLSVPVPMQVAQGSVTTDDRGTRQATLLFPEGTQAQMVMPDGSTQAISSLDVRATEYTVGPNGEEAMPAKLPPGIGYTYAVELSVDAAIAAGAKELTFDQPVPNYLDNFLGFPTGAEIPAFYYDRERAVWVSSAPGRVVEIIGISGDLADVDTDGDGLADGTDALEALGFTDAERQRLASLYPVGKTLWRARLNHFSTVDYNLSYDYPDSDYPSTPNISDAETETEDQSCEEGGSIIECQNQTLGESIPVTGTSFSLNYRSSRTQGRSGAYKVNIPIEGHSCSDVHLTIDVAGRTLSESLSCSPEDQVYEFIWDGTDAYSREVNGATAVTVQIGYAYPARRCYRYKPEGSDEWIEECKVIPDQYDVLWSDQWQGLLGILNASGQGFGGWTLDVQHSYASTVTTLYRGDGRNRRTKVRGSIKTFAGDPDTCENWSPYGPSVTNPCFGGPLRLAVGPDGSVYIPDSLFDVVFRVMPNGVASVVAGTGAVGFNGDGIPATEANMSPLDVAVGPDGSFYINDSGLRVRRVGTDGIITTVAGNGLSGFSGDGGPATEAQFWNIVGIALGSDSSLYIVDANNYRIRRVGTDGIVMTVAGNGSAGNTGDGGPATEASLFGLDDVDVGPDGDIYISLSWYVRHVGTDGIITTFAGQADDSSFLGDGGPAVEAYIWETKGLDLGPDGSLYLAQGRVGSRVRKIDPDGIISTVVGNGGTEPLDENLPATQTGIYRIRDVALGPDGAIYIFENGTNLEPLKRVRRVAPVLPELSVTDFVLASRSGSELYVFDAQGRHLRTINTLTGTVIYTFSYDSNGLLTQVRDAFGNITSVERDVSGSPTAIVAPYGQRTAFTLDANGYLASISNPANETWQFSYTDDGLLTTATDPNENTSTYTYDVSGRLVHTLDAAGGSQTLARMEFNDGYEVTKTTGMGRTTTYRVEQLPTGDKRWLNTAPNGLSVESLFKTDGSQISTSPDGTVVSIVQGPDPRFGMQTPISKSMEVTTPGGLNFSLNFERNVTLADESDPLSLETMTDTTVMNGRSLIQEYNALTRTFTITTPQGRTRTSIFNELGRLVESTLSGLEPVDVSYNANGRITSVVQGAGEAARELSITYDTNGFVASVTDPLLRNVDFEYDAAGRVTRQTLTDGRQVLFDYDNKGNLISLTPPGLPNHNFIYTSVDRLEEYTPPELGATPVASTYIYNLDRQLTQVQRPDGAILDIAYDSAGRISSRTLPRGTVGYSYDAISGKASYQKSSHQAERHSLLFMMVPC